ncbi:hypothetical protein JGS22_024485 [Streptomyces sp. P38-E01]|uniref:Uncharacterized protein n=1 Tax=Streptomyces tardus TaxID=2780544 RepID=A0A949N816_9ACTN|nr:hypothetical protein [Streptomyces tardus]MBU7600697.1 hypothetical protein [Streptomyces tardus]
MTHSAELPWLVRCGEEPPAGLAGYAGSVVQAPRPTAMDALTEMRYGGHAVGPALVCLSHDLLQVPIGPDDGAWRWPPTRTLCRPRSTRCSSADGNGVGYRPCPGRFWLLPHESNELVTDGAALYDVLCTVRSQRRLGGTSPGARHRRRPAAAGEVPDGLYEGWLA